MTIEEVAERLRVHHSTVRRWLKARELKGYPLGDRAGWRIAETDLMEFLERQRAAADGFDEIVRRQGLSGGGDMQVAFGHTYRDEVVEAIRDARVHLARAGGARPDGPLGKFSAGTEGVGRGGQTVPKARGES